MVFKAHLCFKLEEVFLNLALITKEKWATFHCRLIFRIQNSWKYLVICGVQECHKLQSFDLHINPHRTSKLSCFVSEVFIEPIRKMINYVSTKLLNILLILELHLCVVILSRKLRVLLMNMAQK